MNDKRKENREAKRIAHKTEIIRSCVAKLKARIINDAQYKEK